MNDNRPHNPVMRHILVHLDLLAFALVLIGGAFGLLYLNRIGRADKRLYDVGVESLGVMAEMREEFVTLPATTRDMMIGTAPDRKLFDRTKESVEDKLGRVGLMIEGDSEKENMARMLKDQLGQYWEKADECIAICMSNRANKKQEAMLFARQQSYPYFQASQKAMGLLQESMKRDASSQLKSNRATITLVSVAMAVCTVVMATLALLYAGRIARHIL